MASGDTLAVIIPSMLGTTGANDPADGFRGQTPVKLYDDTTLEDAYAWLFMPSYYTGGGVTATLIWSATTATSGAVVWRGSFARIADDADDLDSLSGSTPNAIAATTANVSGEVSYDDITFTSGTQMNSVVAGDFFRLEIERNAGSGSDTMTGDAELAMVVLKET